MINEKEKLIINLVIAARMLKKKNKLTSWKICWYLIGKREIKEHTPYPSKKLLRKKKERDKKHLHIEHQ